MAKGRGKGTRRGNAHKPGRGAGVVKDAGTGKRRKLAGGRKHPGPAKAKEVTGGQFVE